MKCSQEMCRIWTGSGCACLVLDLEPDVIDEDLFEDEEEGR